MSITYVPDPPTFPTGTVGMAYTATFGGITTTAISAAATFPLNLLPPGLFPTITTAGGPGAYLITVLGTPLVAGTFPAQWDLSSSTDPGGITSNMFFITILGDPHLTSFRGEKFDFHGEPSKFYNLYSDRYIQVNSLFSRWDANDFTTMQKIGITFGNLKIKIDAVTQTVSINDVYFDSNCEFMKFVDEVPEKYESMKTELGFGTFIKGVIINLFNYEFFINFASDENIDNPVYCNMKMSINNKIKAHGVIGQTSMYEGELRTSTGRNGEGIVEGNYWDYEVSNLFANDFKYNLFFNDFKFSSFAKIFKNRPKGKFSFNLRKTRKTTHQEFSHFRARVKNKMQTVSVL